jgi:hypothetical protein
VRPWLLLHEFSIHAGKAVNCKLNAVSLPNQLKEPAPPDLMDEIGIPVYG